MGYRDFNHIDKKIPAEDGYYLWDAPFGQIPVIYQRGEWFLRSNKERLPGSIVRRWR